MDRASQALAQDLHPHVPKTYAARSDLSGVPLATIWHRDHGRQSMKDKAKGQQYLTTEEETALVSFLLLMANFGTPVQVKFIPSLALILARERGVTEPPNHNWPRALERRHPEVKARRVKAIDRKRHDIHIYTKIVEWFEVISPVLHDPAVRPENVYNMDETGVMLSKLGSIKVLVGKDDLRDYRPAGVKRTMITAIECISADGRSLLPLIVWPASTHRSNWYTYPTPGWHYGRSENGYNDSKINLEWLTRVFDPQTKAVANGRPRILIADGFGTHETLEILRFCFENHILLCRIPSHTSHKLQPCDIGPFAPLKTAYRDEVERLYRGGLDTVGKEHFISLYKPAREKAISKKNILAGWAATGLFPFNPERVLRHTPKPPPDHTVPEPRVVTCPQDPSLQSPITPVTPVTTEALMSLHGLINRQLSDPSNRRLQRHVQKLASAAKVSFAKQTLLHDQNRFLSKINGEVKARRSTRSLVLGKAKVMSYEDLREAEVKRAAKDKAKTDKGKGKRGRPRKNAVPVAAEDAVPQEEMVVDLLAPEDNVAQPIEARPLFPWMAPIAKMY